MIRTAADAYRDLERHLEPLAAVMDAAHAQFQDECRGIAHILDTKSRASIYRDLIVRKLREYCDETSGATTIRRGQLTLVGLEDNWVLRVNKLRAGFTVSVSPTLASREYDANQLPPSVADLYPEMPTPTCIYFGWNVAENAPGSINKYLVCNDESRDLYWAIPLDDFSIPPATVQDLPLTPVAPSGEPRRVRVKGASARKINE